jgi:hypothetical protein
MRDALISYFAGEKQSALAWGFAGFVSLATADGIFWQARGYRAMLGPLLVFGLVQVGAALVLGLGTDKRVERLLAVEPAKLAADEQARIVGVNRTFVALEATWGALIVAGAVMAFVSRRPTLFALGVGLILEGSAMLALDLAANRRAEVYAEALP